MISEPVARTRVSGVRITHLGTATALIEVDGVRFLTDPVFGAPPATYRFGWGTGSRLIAGPAIADSELPPVDAVLLSHDQHADNLDPAGRSQLTGRPVFTTMAAARRLGGHAHGLRPFDFINFHGVRVTATPARHGPPGVVPFSGPVVGFVIERLATGKPSIYISGDTVWFRGVRQVARAFTIGYAVLHMGAAGFPAWGPLRFTMSSAGAIKAIRALRPQVVVPVHYTSWSHFREPVERARALLAAAELPSRVCWLTPGVATDLETTTADSESTADRRGAA